MKKNQENACRRGDGDIAAPGAGSAKRIDCDVLIIGGGTAGCYGAKILSERNPELKIVIAEKADIKRSGCLAAGVNALNAYITEGHRPEDYASYAMKDAAGIARGDLLLTMSRELNDVTEDLEKLGLVILKDENGKYATRGWRNLKINGENIKPILAAAAKRGKNTRILNHINITRLLWTDGAGPSGTRRIAGAAGFDVLEGTFYDFRARAVLMATGGASGLYRPNNPGFSRHKMWYSPFNTGAGYAMGLEAGAEMTTLEMRFIALRCKDTIAPTGTIAQGVNARQINSRGEVYEDRYGLATSQRLYGTVEENAAGRGPCYLKTAGITPETRDDLYRAYLNMAPSQTLKWLEDRVGPDEANVEIEGTEPYVVGGHTASGYWVDSKRATTIRGLYAAGDVAGGAPQKYVTGALAEAKIAALAISEYLEKQRNAGERETAETNRADEELRHQADAEFAVYRRHLSLGAGSASKTGAEPAADLNACASEDRETLSAASAPADGARTPFFDVQMLEEAMQKYMDQYAGGIGSNYRYSQAGLQTAKSRIGSLMPLAEDLAADDAYQLMEIFQLKERLKVCLALIAHLEARRETRWRSFAENADYPNASDNWLKYVNSRYENGRIKIICRPIVRAGENYEHQN